MYNQVNAHIKPSLILLLGHCALHVVLLGLCIWLLIVNFEYVLYLALLLLVQGYYVYQLYNLSFYYFKHRHWLVLKGRFHLLSISKQAWAEDELPIASNDNAMEVQPHGIWPFILLFRYRKVSAATLKAQGPWMWEMILTDSISQASFHKLAAELNTVKPVKSDK